MITHEEPVAARESRPIRVVGIGGSTHAGSNSEKALRVAMRALESGGAETELFLGRTLMFPIYDTESSDRCPQATALLEAVRRADALVVSSPGYNGTLSGMIKNVFDYFEDLHADPLPYLHGMSVGCISVARGWQAAVSTLHCLRTVTHALRGWPTPMGVAINSSETVIPENGTASASPVGSKLKAMSDQVIEFAHARRIAGLARTTTDHDELAASVLPAKDR
ncbi:NAD(P)H-dependent oxidoreductase [Saccharopolyspora taberi]|uniref:NAD(P)H-dependent oxidoreductase n=1 Tax=Saccharopolyspora taberi TaxID=60895 RepID=A0ABN3VEV0_9PSEU